MPADQSESFTRQDVLDGLFGGHARAASSLLFAIESRTAYLVARSRRVMERFPSEEISEERDLALLEALALGREPPLRPTIQDLERYAPEWASLVPDNPRVQATMAHLLSQKHEFTYRTVPGLRAALALDENEVQQAYQRIYRQSLGSIYATRTRLRDRLRWAWAALAGWLEALPPFWMIFALTLTETVGAGILALPIALAEVGPLPGVAILMVMGLVNIVTIGAMAEAVARNGSIRYGSVFLGRVVTEYLGPVAALILLAGLTIESVLTLWPFYIGFGTTLQDATRVVPAPVWAGLLFLMGLYFLRRDTLNATIASALAIGAVCIGLILALSTLAFARLRPEYLSYVNLPFLGGRPFEPSILKLIFGVVLLAYFGQVSVSNCARVVLHRDSSARSLIRGAMAAQVVVLAIYCVWVLAINGTVAPTVLAEQSGTALAPLAAEIGPSVHVLGSIFVILAMGIGSLHSSLPLCNLVRERLPIKRWTAVLLPRRRGRLVLRNRPNGKSGEGAGLSLGLTYLGLGAPALGESGRKPLFRLDTLLDGRSEHQEMAVSGRWEATALYSRLPLLRQQGASVVMEVLDAGGSYARVRISSPMRLAYEGDWVAAAVGIADVVGLPDLQRQIVTWMVREGMAGHETVSLAEAAASSGQPEAMVRMALDALARQGFVQVLAGDGQIRYAPRMAARRGRQLPEEIKQALWERDEGATRAGPQAGFGPWVREALLGKRGRFLVSVAPVVAVFLLAEWLLLTGRESFSEPLAFLGVIVISLLGGIYPVLMLVAGRRKGEAVPGLVLRALGSPLVVAAIYLLFLTSLILYGLVIWQNPVERAAALATGLLMVGATVWMVRRGAFVGRTVVELREDGRDGGRDVFNVTSCGKPATATVRLGYADGEQTIEGSRGDLGDVASLKQVQFDLAATRARELKVWAHRITLEGNSEGLPAELEVYSGGASQEFDLRLTGGQVVVPIDGGACRLTITLPKSAAV